MDERPYRLNAGVVLFNRDCNVLAGDRIHYPGMYQFPQGGIDPGEDPLEGALRELYEETGIRLSSPPAFEVPEWLTYEFPEEIPDRLKAYRGQKQKWFFFFWDGNPEALSLDHHEQEFRSLQWMSMDEIVDKIIDFKKPVYRILGEYAKKVLNDCAG